MAGILQRRPGDDALNRVPLGGASVDSRALATIICFICKDQGDESMLRSLFGPRRHAEPWYRCAECDTHICDRCEAKLDRTEPRPSKVLWWTSMSSSPKCPNCSRARLTRPYLSPP